MTTAPSAHRRGRNAQMNTRRTNWLLLVVALAFAVPIAALADDYVGTTTTPGTTATTATTTTTGKTTPTTLAATSTSSKVLGSSVTSGSTPTTASVLGVTVSRPEALGGLALTGTDVVGLVALAIGLVAFGLVAVRRARRRVTT